MPTLAFSGKPVAEFALADTLPAVLAEIPVKLIQVVVESGGDFLEVVVATQLVGRQRVLQQAPSLGSLVWQGPDVGVDPGEIAFFIDEQVVEVKVPVDKACPGQLGHLFAEFVEKAFLLRAGELIKHIARRCRTADPLHQKK